jgi:uncharacterized OsmC-like protein
MTDTNTNARIINGVNVEDLIQTVEAVTATPGIADFRFRADNEWLGGGHNRTTISGFYGAGEEQRHATAFVLDNDEPPVLLSGDKAPNPVEYVLHALAGCLMTSLVYHAAARGIAVDGVDVRLEGDLDLHGFLGMDDNVRNGYQAIRARFEVQGDLTDEQKAELVTLAQQRSPVFDIISNRVHVDVDVERS